MPNHRLVVHLNREIDINQALALLQLWRDAFGEFISTRDTPSVDVYVSTRYPELSLEAHDAKCEEVQWRIGLAQTLKEGIVEHYIDNVNVLEEESREVPQVEKMVAVITHWVSNFRGQMMSARNRAEHIYYENVVYNLQDAKTQLSEALARLKIRFKKREDSDG